MRQIILSPKKLPGGKTEDNAPAVVYDTNGPYTVRDISIDVKKGLPRLREQWIKDRGDAEEQAEVSYEYGRARKEDSSLDHLRFAHIQKPLCAKNNSIVTIAICQRESLHLRWSTLPFTKTSALIH